MSLVERPEVDIGKNIYVVHQKGASFEMGAGFASPRRYPSSIPRSSEIVMWMPKIGMLFQEIDDLFLRSGGC